MIKYRHTFQKGVEEMTTHLPFEGLLVYYSGSIRGVQEEDKEFPWQLVEFMEAGGANVLSKHVAARNPGEMEEIRALKMGEGMARIFASIEPWFGVRATDMRWVDKATHMVALVNSPSIGVGMEIQRALDRSNMGTGAIPILCLIRQDLFNADKLTWMIRGICRNKFFLRTYSDLEDAEETVSAFLTGKL